MNRQAQGEPANGADVRADSYLRIFMGPGTETNYQPTRSPLPTFAQEALAAAWATSVNVAVVVKFGGPWWATLPTVAPITLYLALHLALVLRGQSELRSQP